MLTIFAIPKRKNGVIDGVIAQLVEQRTENPCVPGSIPGDTTLKIRELQRCSSLFLLCERVENGWKMGSGFLKSFTQNGNS